MRLQISRRTVALGAVVFNAVGVPNALAIDLGDIQSRERNATDFRDLTPNEPAPAGTLPSTSFDESGVVVFLDNPDFYLRDSNRSWGFFGRGRASIEFSRPMRSVSLAARGSSDQDKAGPIFRNAPLAEAKGLVRALDVNGKVIATKQLTNTSVRTDQAGLITFKGVVKGIAKLELQNLAEEPNAVVVIAGIGITPLNRADLTQDGLVDEADLVLAVMAMGCEGPACPDGFGLRDNRDGSIGPTDVVTIIARLGTN